ncbi:MAG: phosphoribosyltransferase [Oscillospiraceae bacterium]
MESRMHEIRARNAGKVKIGVIPGHFATNHSHVNYYVDMTAVKTSSSTAKEAASLLAQEYMMGTNIDTIVCLEGTEMLGAFLAQALSDPSIPVLNAGHDINVITPELNASNQMIFRDNTQKMIWSKHILLLMASVSTGKTINRAVECLQYYGGNLVAISAIFSAAAESRGIKINSIFTPGDIPEYQSYGTGECPLCAAHKKVDAIVNSYGYSKI